MNLAQLQATRELWADASTPETTKTAVEMALTPHNLSRDGKTAKALDGGKWHWNASRRLWVRA